LECATATSRSSLLELSTASRDRLCRKCPPWRQSREIDPITCPCGATTVRDGSRGGHGFWRDEATPTFFNTIDPAWILSSRPFDPRVAFYRHCQPISPQMNCRCDGRCGPPVSGGGLVHGSSRQIFDPRDHQSTVRVTPLTHEPQQPLQRPAQLGQRLLNFRRHLSIHLAMNQPVAFEFP
jgi:hypothetical protein